VKTPPGCGALEILNEKCAKVWVTVGEKDARKNPKQHVEYQTSFKLIWIDMESWFQLKPQTKYEFMSQDQRRCHDPTSCRNSETRGLPWPFRVKMWHLESEK